MPQRPLRMTTAEAELKFFIEITDAPQPAPTPHELRIAASQPWWARRLRASGVETSQTLRNRVPS